ncbi:AMP-binding protein, partial [Paenibacillus sp. 598K]|uniref:AMP-binding protein n=1 Tax=Paenibacillus sp. 598K TaxID=1117987 RepID=UPI0011CEE80E
ERLRPLLRRGGQRITGASNGPLDEQEVADGTVVAVLCPPSCLRAVCVMGALQAGAAFLPIDPASPDERIRYMLQDSGAAALLGLSVDAERL